MLPDGQINFEKMYMLSRVFSQITAFQRFAFCLDVVPTIREYLLNLVVRSEDELWVISRNCESRHSQAAQAQANAQSGRRQRRGSRVKVQLGPEVSAAAAAASRTGRRSSVTSTAGIGVSPGKVRRSSLATGALSVLRSSSGSHDKRQTLSPGPLPSPLSKADQLKLRARSGRRHSIF
jgi:hypothetical protein